MATKAAAFVVPALTLFSLSVFAFDRPPDAVSPGEPDRLVQIRDDCPTFSWGAVPGATQYELMVYAASREPRDYGVEPEPRLVLGKRLPGSASSWTPPLENCLKPGGRYAWVVRAVGEEEVTDWSEARLFEVPTGPSEADFKQALEIVRSYLSATDQVGDEALEPPFPTGKPEEKARPPKGLAKPKAATSAPFSVDGIGNVQAASFTGDGSAVSNVTAVDLNAAAPCVSELELEFDPATQTELTTHAALASAHHSPTVDTTCDGAACNGTLFTNVTAADLACLDCVSEAELSFDPAMVGGSPVVTVATLAGALCSSTELPFLDQGDGTVLDCNTGLIWLKNANCCDFMSWWQAESDAAGLEDGKCGLTDGSSPGDWRQPTISEFCSAWSGSALAPCPAGAASDSLIDSSAGPPVVVNARGDGVWTADDAFVNVGWSFYWSASEVDAGFAWLVLLGNGDVFFAGKDGNAFVWPVRGGP